MDDPTPTSAPVRYYRTDIRKLSYAECFRMGSLPVGLIAAFIKLFRIPVPVAAGTPWTESLRRLESADLEPGQCERLLAKTAELQALGFNLQFFYAEEILGPTRGAASALLSGNERIYASAIDSEGLSTTPPIIQTDVALFSRVGGRVIVTGGRRSELDGPPEIQSEVVEGQPLAAVLAHHERRLEAATTGEGYRDLPPVEPFEADRLEAFIVGLSQRFVTFNAERGILVAMGEDEVQALRHKEGQPPARRAQPGAVVTVWIALIIILTVLLYIL